MTQPQPGRQQRAQQQTTERWQRCQQARVEQGSNSKAGHEAALKIWSDWAEPILAKRRELESEGRWRINRRPISGNRDRDAWIAGHTPEMQAWLWQARVDFSGRTLATSSDLEKLDFSGFAFPGEALFVGTVFEDETWFEGAKFYGDAWVREHDQLTYADQVAPFGTQASTSSAGCAQVFSASLCP
jgi:hypothetical protein